MATPHSMNSPSTVRRAPRDVWGAIKRGWLGHCPRCGEGRLFRAFLKPVDHCSHCNENLQHQRADDLPPYLVIFVVGHVMVGAYLLAERMVTLNSWQHLAIWTPMTIVIALAMMQPTKGAVIGLQWANYMHGFGDQEGEAEILQRD